MKNRNRLQRQSLFDDPHSLSATGLAMVGHFDSAVREHHLVFVQDYHRRSAPRAVGSRGCIAALINILAGHAGLRREETRSGASSFQFSDCRYLPMTWPDLSPFFHPAMSRVLASFEPVWLDDATG